MIIDVTILEDVGIGIFGWYEPDNSSEEYYTDLIQSAKRYYNFIKEVLKYQNDI